MSLKMICNDKLESVKMQALIMFLLINLITNYNNMKVKLKIKKFKNMLAN